MKNTIVIIVALCMALTSASQNKLRVMFWPSKPYLKRNNLMIKTEVNGKMVEYPDYAKCSSAAEQSELNNLLSELAEKVKDYDFDAVSYHTEFIAMEEARMSDENAMEAYSGLDNLGSSPISDYSKADFNVFVDYSFVETAGQIQLLLRIEVSEPGTGRIVGNVTYNSPTTSDVTKEDLLRNTYIAVLDELADKMSKEGADIRTNGAYITLTLVTTQESGLMFSQMIGDNDLSGIVKTIIGEASMARAIGKQFSGPKQEKFVGLRIPYLNEDGSPKSASDFAKTVLLKLKQKGIIAEKANGGVSSKAIIIIKGLEK